MCTQDLEQISLVSEVGRKIVSEYDIKRMVFSSNSLRLLDIRGSYCHIWEPAVLVRKEASESTSVKVSEGVQVPKIDDVKAWDRNRDLSALAAHDSGEYLFAGREDGAVALFETRTGSISQELYQHAKFVGITTLAWSQKVSALASSDTSGRYIVRSINRDASRLWVVKDAVIDSRSAGTIEQMIFSSDGQISIGIIC